VTGSPTKINQNNKTNKVANGDTPIKPRVKQSGTLGMW